MSNEIARYSEETFESIKHVNEYGNEFWYARELQSILEYTEWRNFQKLIEKAQTATWLWMNVLLRSTKHRPCRTVVLS